MHNERTPRFTRMKLRVASAARQTHQVLVCNARRNALLKEGSKNDQVDARKLANLLRTGMLRPENMNFGHSG